MTKDWLLKLDQINLEDRSLVGGKALNLATLSRNGLSTPPGLILTSAFFEAQINHFSYKPIWAGSPDVAVTESSLEFLADFLKTTPLAPNLDRAFKAKLKEVFGPNIQSFAVRSSAIDEDNLDQSFAGTYLTELGVPRDLLTVSLTRCWASALSGQAIKYRLQRGLSIQSIRMAVLIQPMLKPQVSGVGFTLNPVTGARDELVIEATAGLGEAAIGGRITPYRYNVSRRPPDYPLLKKIPGDTINLVREPLSTRQLTMLAQTLEQVEAMMGVPQDAEWAFEGDYLYLLQARPITVVPQTPVSFFDTEWTRANHLEVLPDLPSPLFVSLTERTQDRGTGFFREVGVDVMGVGPYMKSIYGRPYLNLSMIKRILTQFGFNSIPLLGMVGYVKPGLVSSNPFGIDWTTVWQARGYYFKLLTTVLKMGQSVRLYQEKCSQIIVNLKQRPQAPADMLHQFKLREQVYGELISTALILVSALTSLMVLIAKIIAPITASPERILGVLSEVWGNNAATQYSLTLLRLAHKAKTDRLVFRYLTRPHNDFKDYQAALSNTSFLVEFEAYLKVQGNRAQYEPDMGLPRFREQAAELLRTIGQYAILASKGNLDAPKERPKQSVFEIWRHLTNQGKGLNLWLPWRRIIALPLMYLLRGIFALREDIRTAEAEGMAAVRAWDLDLATRWVEAGYLETTADYFWLNMEEIERAIVAEDDAGVYLKPAVAVRKETYQAYQEISMPPVIKDSEIPSLHFGELSSQEILPGTLMGLPVSPGQVQGVIKVLTETDDLSQIPEGSILVTPSTDPSWLRFFPLGVGLIVEVGGMLSHGSIIAREYGLPAVSNITDARKRLKSGDRVLLDGSTGVVQILEVAA